MRTWSPMIFYRQVERCPARFSARFLLMSAAAVFCAIVMAFKPRQRVPSVARPPWVEAFWPFRPPFSDISICWPAGDAQACKSVRRRSSLPRPFPAGLMQPTASNAGCPTWTWSTTLLPCRSPSIRLARLAPLPHARLRPPGSFCRILVPRLSPPRLILTCSFHHVTSGSPYARSSPTHCSV